jgi:AcrR family transcriptional regulator
MAKAKAKTTVRARDREATEARLIEALERVLSRDGFRGLGVNSVAREAGVDKVLIYRYFGDLDGLIEAFGQRLDLWVGEGSSTPARGNDYAARMQHLLRDYVQALRSNSTLRQILAWELVDSSPIMQKLDSSRSKAVGAWFARARGVVTPPADVDAPALNTLILAGMHYLVLREQSIGAFAGMDLRDPASWKRLERAAERLLSCAYPTITEQRQRSRRADR